MPKTPKIFYKYRAFSTTTLDMLCHDTAYFANPGSFNDPLDCNPTLECDSSVEDLRRLLEFLLRRRVTAEVLENLKGARLKGNGATEHAKKRAAYEAEQELANIAYHATNPDYQGPIEENESWLLVSEIERELHRRFERGVCCFSSTYSSPLLWSHYGDQHKGICIGYGTERIPVPHLQKVVYGGSRAIKTSTLVDAYLYDREQAISALDRDVLLRKARGWRYEREWRLIGEQGEQASPLLLTEVTFGLRCASSVRHAIVRALDGRTNEVKFYEMREVRGSYALRRGRLDADEFGSDLPNTAISGEEMFGPVTN